MVSPHTWSILQLPTARYVALQGINLIFLKPHLQDLATVIAGLIKFHCIGSEFSYGIVSKHRVPTSMN